jgi:hypothetical protein
VPLPPPDLPGADDTGERARVALWAGLVASILQVACSLIVFASFADTFSKALDDAAAGRRSTTPTMANDPLTLTANLLSNLLGIVLLVVGVLFLIWFHKALTNARSLGLPLTRSPGWGVAGFFIPIVSLWFPYQSMRDLFPPTHPARGLVGRWWATYLGAGFAGFVTFIVALFSPVAGWMIGVVTAGLYVVAAVTARQLIAASTDAHRELAAAGAWAPPPGPPGWPGGPGGQGGPGQPVGWSSPPAGPAPGAPNGWTPPPAAPPKDPWNRT